MDSYLDDSYNDTIGGLSYDDSTTYEEQVAQIPLDEQPVVDAGDVAHAMGGELASRISTNKAYLAPESAARVKRKRGDDDEDEDEEETMEVEDITVNGSLAEVRQNALLLKGTPISHLPTGRVFVYARHFDTDPVALEWVDDTTCVLVFRTKASARSAYNALLKDDGQVPDEDGLVTAKSLPVALWPPEDRINKTLGMGEGLKGAIRMRWAHVDDVKRKGASKESAFYRKHGVDAGKDPNTLVLGRNPEGGDRKRQRGVDEEDKRRMLDAELDAFLAQDDDDDADPDLANNNLHKRLSSPQPERKLRADAMLNGRRSRSPPSKMRADYIDGRGRTLLERTSLMRVHPNDSDFEGNLRVREWDRDRVPQRERGQERGPRRRGRRAKEERQERPVRALPQRGERPKKTQQELDDELESFLNERD